jgi:hypothetical protein
MQKSNNFFTEKNAFKTIDKLRILYLVAAVICYGITEMGRFVYRPYIYDNNIDDYGIADSIGNSGGIMVQIFLSLAILNPPKEKAYRIFIFLVAGYIVYEIAQEFLPKGVFDWKDVIGTIVGGGIAFILYQLIIRFIKNKVYHQFKQ